MPVFNPNIQATTPPPVMEARRWIEGVSFPPADRPLINVSQAAPVDPPHPELRQAIAHAALNEDSAHLYGPPVLGLPDLRAEVAHQWAAAYGGEIAFENVAITSGCNQAFAATMATIAAPGGDEVILPTPPWYFNHKMWLDMGGITALPLATGDDLLPDPQAAEALITPPRTRAISLVTPNNPGGGVEYPSDLVRTFFDLARKHRIVLIIDETYRDFDSRDGAPHDLFMTPPDWQENLVQLYSFSKAYRLTGHRSARWSPAPPNGWPRSRSSWIPSRFAPPPNWVNTRPFGGACATCPIGSVVSGWKSSTGAPPWRSISPPCPDGASWGGAALISPMWSTRSTCPRRTCANGW